MHMREFLLHHLKFVAAWVDPSTYIFMMRPRLVERGISKVNWSSKSFLPAVRWEVRRSVHCFGMCNARCKQKEQRTPFAFSYSNLKSGSWRRKIHSHHMKRSVWSSGYERYSGIKTLLFMEGQPIEFESDLHELNRLMEGKHFFFTTIWWFWSDLCKFDMSAPSYNFDHIK